MMQDLAPDNDKEEGRRRTRLLLNTPGACFLCLQDNYGGCDPLEDFNGGIIDLTNICRYLNINQCSLLSTSFKNNGGDSLEDLERQLCSFSVKLCSKCLELTRKLNDMIVQLEKVKLMVNFHLTSFHKVLEGNDMENSLEWINLLGRMHAKSNNSFEAKLVQLLREEAQAKSFKILKKAEAAMPQVILSKLVTPSPSPKFRPSLSVPSTPLPPTTFPSIKAHLSHLVSTSAIPSPKSSKSKLHRCPYCSKVLVISKFAIHLACQHSHHLLSSPSSEATCKQVLYTEVICKATKYPSPSTPTSPRLGCHLCGITYSDGNLLKHHFLISHTDQLILAIINYQPEFKNPATTSTKPLKKKSQLSPASQTVNQLLKNWSQIYATSEGPMDTNNPSKVNKKFRCPFCVRVSPTSSKFVLHISNFHPHKLLESPVIQLGYHPKVIQDNPNDFSQLCANILAGEVAKCKKADGQRASKLVCHLCGHGYHDPRDLKHHLLVTHTDNLCDQLIKGQDKSKVKVRPKKGKSKKAGKSLEDKTCEICGIFVPNLNKMKRHRLNNHPEHLFSECKASWIGGEQFKGICQEIFRREVAKATYGKPGDKIYRCGDCPVGGGDKVYKWPVDFMVHLAYEHREEMEGKLRQGGVVEGMGEEDGGGDEVILEETAVDIGELNELLYPDTVLNEGGRGEGGFSEEDGNLEYLEQQYGYFGEEDVVEGTGGGRNDEVDERNVTEGPSESELVLIPVVKMEVDETIDLE